MLPDGLFNFLKARDLYLPLCSHGFIITSFIITDDTVSDEGIKIKNKKLKIKN